MSGATLSRLSFAYPGQDHLTLADVDWTVDPGSFVLLAGPSGSGKSTLLRCLNGLVPHFSGGAFGGTAIVDGHDTRAYPPRAMARSVGFVFQDPEAQLVTTRVDDEIAFGMEQLGVPPITMRKRVEEVLDLLGIASLRERDIDTLSGGERQRVAVAAALALHPAILALDEPTSQLDPWGADDVLTALTRLNDDLGLTVVLAEHRLDRVLANADRMRLLSRGGALVADAPPRDVLPLMDAAAMPPLARVGTALGWAPLPLTIKEARQRAAEDAAAGRLLPPAPPDPSPQSGAPVIDVQRLTAGFGRRTVLRGVDLAVRPGELVALMGRNGSGKTTLLRSLLGLHAPQAGRIIVLGQDVARTRTADLAMGVGYVPQNPSSMLFADTLREELAFTLRNHPGGADPEETLASLGLLHAIDRHPRDLSGGERERAALAAILVGNPRVLLLDEPTRGMDADARLALAATLERLRLEGIAIVMATHDVELVAATATRVVIIGDGTVIADGGPRAVLSGSLSFATQVNKVYGGGYLVPDDVGYRVSAVGHRASGVE
jgi:energy-coupling factor transporter ATP-binding protein EcfA2